MATVSADDYYQSLDLKIPEHASYRRFLAHDASGVTDYYLYDSYYYADLSYDELDDFMSGMNSKEFDSWLAEAEASSDDFMNGNPYFYSYNGEAFADYDDGYDDYEYSGTNGNEGTAGTIIILALVFFCCLCCYCCRKR
jgi:hypothetical protein